MPNNTGDGFVRPTAEVCPEAEHPGGTMRHKTSD